MTFFFYIFLGWCAFITSPPAFMPISMLFLPHFCGCFIITLFCLSPSIFWMSSAQYFKQLHTVSHTLWYVQTYNYCTYKNIRCIFGFFNYYCHILFTCCLSTLDFFYSVIHLLISTCLNFKQKIYMYKNMHITSAIVNKYITPLFAFVYTCLSETQRNYLFVRREI